MEETKKTWNGVWEDHHPAMGTYQGELPISKFDYYHRPINRSVWSRDSKRPPK